MALRLSKGAQPRIMCTKAVKGRGIRSRRPLPVTSGPLRRVRSHQRGDLSAGGQGAYCRPGQQQGRNGRHLITTAAAYFARSMALSALPAWSFRLAPQTTWRGERVGRDPLAPHHGVPRADGTQTEISILPESPPAHVPRSRWSSSVRTDDDQRRCRRR
jgi:hypothetical protein